MKKLFHFIRHHAVRLAKLSHTTSAGVRIDIKNQMEQRIYKDIFVDGDYDEAILKLLSNSKGKSLTVLDLGSNVMFFTFRLIDLASGKPDIRNFIIHCIEASEKLIHDSQRRIQISDFSKDRFQISLHHGLIGHREGGFIFYHFKDHGLSSVFRETGKPQQLSFINVSELMKNSTTIDLLKCDIEGSEGDFIRHYPDILKKTSMAVFEFHLEYCQYEECLQSICNAGLIHSQLIRSSTYSKIELFWR